MEQNFLKITYHLGAKKMNAYLKMPSPTYNVLKKEIEMCLFEERKQPRCEIRTFWIDDDQDEIEIVNQCDYEIFMAKRSDRKHLQVSPINNVLEQVEVPVEAAAATQTSKPSNESSSTSAKQTKIPPAAGSSKSSGYDFAVHDHVECDACLMSPIMGFRYKCIQCPNYDLCQNCESKHIHSEHMMVRMPTNNCPNVIEAYVTGRTSSGRRHGKRSKTSCPFVKNGLSIVIDDDNDAANNAGNGGGNAAETNDQSSPSGNGKERHHGRKHHRRHHRNNFFSHLYEMMHDLAEGGGAAAAAHAMGETTTTSATKANTTTTTSSSTTGPETTTTTTKTTTSSTNATAPENVEDPIGAIAAQLASQHAHEAAVKAAEIAAKVAHEVAMSAANSMTENIMGSSQTSATSNNAGTASGEKEASKEKADNTSTPRDYETQPNSVPVIPSPSLETIAQFLDPQYMKTGIQILNNFSDMFAKMLDPMDTSTETPIENQIYPNLRKNSTTSTKSSENSNLNSFGSADKKSDKEKSLEKEQTTETAKQPESDISSHVEIDDLGSDSENDSVSESFIKLDAPKESNVTTASTSKSVSAQTTPPQSLDKSKTMDFAQLSADLKAHIAEEAKKNTETLDSVDNATAATETITSTTATANEPVVSTTSSTSTSTSTTSSATNATKKPEEKRAVPVYHADQQINNAVHAMMSMGFSNEGAWLTQLLESVNGNIAEALDLMSVAQRSGGGR